MFFSVLHHFGECENTSRAEAGRQTRWHSPNDFTHSKDAAWTLIRTPEFLLAGAKGHIRIDYLRRIPIDPPDPMPVSPSLEKSPNDEPYFSDSISHSEPNPESLTNLSQ